VNARLPREFFARPTLTVARDLLGARLVRLEGDQRLAGVIIETEAYIGEEDQGCHCRHGPTPRARLLYGPPGMAYVYFTYGMHWLFNVVTQREGFPAAVLIRALWPTEGLERMAQRRAPHPMPRWADGPAKLCRALGIDGGFHGLDLGAPKAPLFFETGIPIPDNWVITGPRVGLNRVPEPWKSIPWRFRLTQEALQQLRQRLAKGTDA